MKLARSGATPSSIVEVSRAITKRSAEENAPYLHLERGVPGVQPIDLGSIIPLIDVNSPSVQTYPPSSGQPALKEAVNKAYFGGKASLDRLIITPGSSMGLDTAFQMIDTQVVSLPFYHWGTYRKILQTRRRAPRFYQTVEELRDHPDRHDGTAVVLCDPNNPVGDLQPDGLILDTAERLGKAGAAVILDCPYRRLFFPDDDFYIQAAALPNVILLESFSKSLGLSGLRLGFAHLPDPECAAEFGLRLALPTNGVDNLSQFAVEKLLSHPAGIEVAADYAAATAADIRKNIDYLEHRNLLAGRFYAASQCTGIFAVVNRTAEQLLAARIGAISMEFFVASDKEDASRFARINVAVPSDAFKAYFDALP
ncbi:MAG: pyridoxal phosphate-dependent aminotransferase [Candidatus Aminicenantes bacterium]|nr:pyridoxal phosphate-dependent aminotransferase [Candidatus Aminicenantes bacterium]